MTDEPKSLAHPAWPYTGTPWEWRSPPQPTIPPTHYWWGQLANITPAPVGCVCPPTSEQTCKNDKCPRK